MGASMKNNVSIASGCSGAPAKPVTFDLPGSSKTRRGKKRNAEATGEPAGGPDFSPEKMEALLKKLKTLEEKVSQQVVDAESAEQQRKCELKSVEQKWLADLQTKEDMIKTQDQQIEALKATKGPKSAAPPKTPKTEREFFRDAMVKVAMHILRQNEDGVAVPFQKPNQESLSKGKDALQGVVPPPDFIPVNGFPLAQKHPLLRSGTMEGARKNVYVLAWELAKDFVILSPRMSTPSNRFKIVAAYIIEMMGSGRIMKNYEDARQHFKELMQVYIDAAEGAAKNHLKDMGNITTMILIKAKVPVDGEPMDWPGTPEPQSKRKHTTGSAGAKKNTPDKNAGSSNPSTATVND